MYVRAIIIIVYSGGKLIICLVCLQMSSHKRKKLSDDKENFNERQFTLPELTFLRELRSAKNVAHKPIQSLQSGRRYIGDGQTLLSDMKERGDFSKIVHWEAVKEANRQPMTSLGIYEELVCEKERIESENHRQEVNIISADAPSAVDEVDQASLDRTSPPALENGIEILAFVQDNSSEAQPGACSDQLTHADDEEDDHAARVTEQPVHAGPDRNLQQNDDFLSTFDDTVFVTGDVRSSTPLPP